MFSNNQNISYKVPEEKFKIIFHEFMDSKDFCLDGKRKLSEEELQGGAAM